MLNNQASALNINPFILNFTAYIATPMNIGVNITNTDSFINYNVSILNSSYFSLTPFNLNPGESKIVQLVFKTENILLNQQLPVTFIYYKQENVTIPPTTSFIIIANNSFNPNIITIYKGSFIQWNNIDDTIHNVQDIESIPEFNTDILSGQTFTQGFNTIKNYTYRDRFYAFSGTINVLSENQIVYTHNQDNDVLKVFNVSTTYNSTRLSIETIPSNISMNYNETKEGVLRVTNDGSYSAYNVYLSGEWLVFSENHFNLYSGQTKYITYAIYPSITNTEDTNKTYVKNIQAVAVNSNISNSNLSVFIYYSANIASGNSTDLAYLQYLNNIFCPSHPTSFLCNQTSQTVYVNQTVYKIPDLWTNWTAEDVAAVKTGNADALSKYMGFSTFIQQTFDNINSLLNNLTKDMNETKTNAQQTKDDQDKLITSIFILSGIIIAGVIIFFIFMFLDKQKKKFIDIANNQY
jgi:hypothetical protein